MTLKRFIKRIVLSLPLVLVVVLGGLYYYNLLTMPILIRTDEFNKEDAILLSKFINSNLQQQLKLMYDYWFTQFDFPDENGKPYKSSGGKMKWNSELQRYIPEGWTSVSLGEILKKK